MLAACSGNLSIVDPDTTDAEAVRYAGTNDLQAEVDSLVQPLIDRGVTPGAVVGVLLPDGHMKFFGYGVKERGRSERPDGDTLFAVGSLSKGFVAALAALMIQDGQLSWDDTLEKLLPDAPLSSDAKKITVLSLATHTSGLPRQPYTPEMLTLFFRYLFTGESFYEPLTRAYVLDYLASFDAPTEKAHYSNIGYGVFTYVLERQSGMSIDSLLDQRIVKPLGLTHTGYHPELLPGYATRARGHAGDQPKFIRRGEPVPDWDFTDFMHGTAGLYSSAHDLLIFAAAHLRHGNTPFDVALADNLRVRFLRERGAAAIAWVVDRFDDQIVDYQIGTVAGYSSYLGVDPTHRTAVVVLRNSFEWDASIGHKLLVRLGRAEDFRHARASVLTH
jgi:CubicO group peptidase (beta-lactamase class C family)